MNVVITGTSSGFGKITAKHLARAGHTVFATMRGVSGKNAPAADELRTFAASEKVALHVLELDVTDDASVADAVARIEAVGPIDVVINNADRKAGHVLKSSDGQFWLIDHGVTFHAQHKLRTVIWDFAGEPLPDDLCSDLQAFRTRLEEDEDLRGAFDSLLDPLEVAALRRRIERLVDAGVFPQPRSNYSYPWPPI
jgi:uncharacterized repeat protein (TIGR03843 family)